MSSRPKLFVASLLFASAVAVPACKPDRTSHSEPQAGGKVVERQPARPRGMPRPLPLPSHPKFAVHVAIPQQALAALGQLTGQGSDPRAVMRMLAAEIPAAFGAATFFDAVDLERPCSAVLVENQLVIRFGIRPGAMTDTRRMLASRPAVGNFGAVELARPTEGDPVDPAPPRLAWLDDDTATLTLATDERGLATGRELAGTYGKAGLFLTIDGAEIRKAVPQFPFDRIGLEGKSVADFHITAQGDGAIEGLDQITEGALTGLLSTPELAAGVSSRYAKYESVVKSMISEASRTVEKQNFLVQGVLEDMLKRYKSVLRSWNGRVMVGVGPKAHLITALGSDDPKKGAAALTSLIDAVMGNLDLARTFGVSVPKLRFKRNRMVAAGVSIHVLAVENARKSLPPELAGLIDDKGDLRIAFGGSENAGAVLFAVGPTATESLARWIESTKDAAPGHKTKGDLVAATFAVDAGAIPGLASGSPSLATLLTLAPQRAPTEVVATRKDTAFDIHVTGPVPKVAARRVAPPPGRPGDPQAVPPRAAGRRPPG